MRPARGAERRGKRQIHQQKARGPARAMGQVWAAQRGGRAHKEADLVAPRPTPGRRKIKFSLVRNLSRYCSYLFSFVFNCGPHNSRARCSLRLHVNHCGTRPPRPPLCSSRLPPRPHADAAGHLLARAHHARLARATRKPRPPHPPARAYACPLRCRAPARTRPSRPSCPPTAITPTR